MSSALITSQLRSRREGGRELATLVWRFPAPLRAIASAPHGGGLGVRRWVVNAQVPISHGRRDPDNHLRTMAVSLGLPGRGVGMLTAADVRQYVSAGDGGVYGGVEVWATVGLGHPILAAAPDEAGPISLVGTINLVVVLPERLSDAALVNAVATVTEAKAQAMWDLGHRATGTATDAVCILCPDKGRAHTFGGPRSMWGARVARAVHCAVMAGGVAGVAAGRGPAAGVVAGGAAGVAAGRGPAGGGVAGGLVAGGAVAGGGVAGGLVAGGRAGCLRAGGGVAGVVAGAAASAGVSGGVVAGGMAGCLRAGGGVASGVAGDVVAGGVVAVDVSSGGHGGGRT